MDAERRYEEQKARTSEVAALCRDTTNKLIQERNNWKMAAESLARQLGKVEYAEVEYQNMEEGNQ